MGAIEGHATLPPTQTAVLQLENGELGIATQIPIPQIEPDMVLVKIEAVALNPTDYKMPKYFPSPGALCGCDFAGTIVRVGSAVTQDFIPGDRVCGAVHGSNPQCHHSGAFANYVAATADIMLRIPDKMSWETAAAIGGTGIGTLGLALNWSLGLPSPDQQATCQSYVLVYGGSTSTGTMAIQLVRLSGLIPIVTCSPRNFDLVKSFGAEIAFDYNSPSCAQDIRKYTKNALAHALDTIADARSIAICYAAIGRAGGKYTALEKYPSELCTRPTVRPDWVMGITIFGREIGLANGYEREACPQHRDFGAGWFAKMQKLVAEEKLKSHPIQIKPGFDGILSGLEELRQGAISGQKIVCVIPST